MTGSQLKIEIKKLNLTQESAANMLGVTRQTLGVWFKYANIDDATMQLVSAKLGITDALVGQADNATLDRLLAIIESQQRIIENLSNKG